METTLRIGIVGTGNMGGAIIGGLINAHLALPENIFAFDADPARLKKAHMDFELQVCSSSLEVLGKAEFVVLAVKPQNMRELLVEIKPAVKPGHCFLSVAAGIRTQLIEQALGNTRVVRAMSNTPALVGAGATAVASGNYALPQDLQLAERIFGALGIVVKVDERHLDAVTALSGSGPAYFFFLVECLIEAAQKAGLPPETAEKLAKQTALGAGLLLNKSADSPAALRQKVTSPGGTTAAAMSVFLDKGFKDLVIEAIERATARGKELSK